MKKTILVETYLGKNCSWPGTIDNPMRPELYKHPVTGEECQAHYNSRNLITDKDYEEAGFVLTHQGWRWPVMV